MFYLRLRTELQPKSWAQTFFSEECIRGLVFGGKLLGIISQSQIKGDYNFSHIMPQS